MNSQLAFQRTNENIRESSFLSSMQDSTNSEFLATNTVKSATIIDQNIQFNQLFNHVNHIKFIKIKPYEVQQVILAFLPEQSTNNNELFQKAETFDLRECNGLIFLLCYQMTNTFDPLNSDLAPDFQVN